MHVAYAQQHALQLMDRAVCPDCVHHAIRLILGGTTPTMKAQNCSGQQKLNKQELSGTGLYQDLDRLGQDWIRTGSRVDH